MNWKEDFAEDIFRDSKGIKTELHMKVVSPKLPNDATQIIVKHVGHTPYGEIKEINVAINSCFDNGEPYNEEIDGGFCINEHHIPHYIRHVCPISDEVVCEVPGCGIKVRGIYYAKPYGYLAIAGLILRLIFIPIVLLIRALTGIGHSRESQRRQDTVRLDMSDYMKKNRSVYGDKTPPRF